MPRNLDNRVEIAFPVLAPALQAQLRAVLDTQLADNVKARIILPDGRSERVAADGGPPLRSQDRLYELTGATRDDSSRSPIRSSEPAPRLHPGPSPEGQGIAVVPSPRREATVES